MKAIIEKFTASFLSGIGFGLGAIAVIMALVYYSENIKNKDKVSESNEEINTKAKLPSVELSEDSTYIVMARSADEGTGPIGITNQFDLDGKIYIYMAFNWDDLSREGGSQNITVKWYNGDKLVSISDKEYDFGKPPHFVWISKYAVGLRPGKIRAEVFSRNKYLGQTNFEILDKNDDKDKNI